MKIVGVIVLVILVVVSGALAQEPSTGITGVGVKLGLGFSTLDSDFDEIEESESQTGGTIGAFLTYGLSPSLSLQAEVVYILKGATHHAFFLGERWSHHYLEIPVLLKYQLTNSGKIRPSLSAGPAMAFLLSSQYNPTLGPEMDISDAMTSTDFSLVIGGAIEYRRFAFEMRYEYGLTNVYDPDEWNRLLDAESPTDLFHMKASDEVRNRMLLFTVAYRL